MPRLWLANIFSKIGLNIGKYPFTSILIFILTTLLPLIFGIFFGVKPELSLNDGFVSFNSPSKKELLAQKYFFGETEKSKEWYMALFGIANNEINGDKGGNMLEESNYKEFNSFYQKIFNNLTIKDFKNLTYSQICNPFCDINDQFLKLMEYSTSWLSSLGQVKFSYPISKVLGYDVNIGKVSIYLYTVFSRLIPLGNCFFNPSVAWGIIQGRGIIRDLKFERVVGYLWEGDYCFNSSVAGGIIRERRINGHIFNRSINEKGEIINATMIALYFSTFINDNSTKLFLNKFEEKVAEEAEIFNNLNKNNIKIIVHGSNVVQKEIERGIINDGKIAVISFLISIFFFILIHSISGYIYSQFTLNRTLISLLCIPSIILILLAVFGGISLFGFPINLLHFSTPLIGLTILNIAHGTFQLGDIWCKLLNESKERQYSSNERLAKVFEKICPSMFYSSLWPISAFSILSLTLTALNYKSLFLAITLLFIYCFLFKLLFFSPLLAYYCHHSVEHSLLENSPYSLFNLNSKEINTKNNLLPPTIQQLRSKKENKLNKNKLKLFKNSTKIFVNGEKIFSNFLINSINGRCFILLITILFLFLSFWKGIHSIQNNMDYREILPKESKAIKGFDIMDLIWNDFLQILSIIQKPPNFEDSEQFGEFKEFLHEATSLNQTLQPSAHMSWLFDYYKDKFNENILQNIKINFVNMSKFDSFINNFPYNAWKSGVRYKIFFDENKNKSSVIINKMLILFAYGNTKGLSGKRKLINECRSVAKRYPQFKINIFDTDLKTTDLMNLIEIIIFR
ncbi:unnamed protein product [Meloidogyne enterolobii]|uniref:Uncharacterized protein n=1 Tax=Meloidogyne enterolobii TaxID=390850 RepID=A0ACB0ZKY3_MELEN